jgi:hypothetical protein
MAELEPGVLDEAASGLLAVGCADPFGTDPAVRVQCLWAVERLRGVGARPVRVLEPMPTGEIERSIRTALADLTSLAPENATRWAVVDAIAAARAALQALA